VDYRIERVMKYYGAASRDDAARMIKTMDKSRRNYYEYYCGYQWGGQEGHDVLIDSSIYGIQGTADILIDLAKKKIAAMTETEDAQNVASPEEEEKLAQTA